MMKQQRNELNQDQDERVRTLLVVEDNALNRSLLSEILGREYDLVMTKNGREGIAALMERADELSAILLDIEMPIMNGHQFLEIVSGDPSWKRIPIIVMTATNEADVEERCLELGASDFLRKPYNSRLVRARIANAIRMSETSQALRELERDELTGVYTKQAFLRRAAERVKDRHDTEFGVMAFDIEDFKLANDQYGEERCDEFLAYIGSCIRSFTNHNLVGRFDGDKFVVLYEMKDRMNPFEINHLRADIMRQAPIPNQVAKIGIYAPIDHNVPIARCCDRAIMAIHEVRGTYGKNISFYDESMSQKLIEEQKIQACMEEALLNDQFQVYYQPKHESITGKIAGAEALVRWIHPEYGFMNPGRFIPLFEKNGFITKLDAYVMRQVCRDIKRWKETGIPVVPISINVSRRDYFEEGWIDKRLDMIDSFGIDHSLMHMEVTESMYAEHTDLIVEQIKRFQNHGYLIEMDDFGAGYSSLGMLATFPLDVIKLDISFVRQLETNEIVIENIINLAHRMGFKTVAEGAETEQQFHVLRSLGCDYIQGYYFSKPLSVADFELYIQEKACDTVELGEEDEIITQKWSEITGELEIKNTLLSCIKILSDSNESTENRVNQLLSIIGKFYDAERTYIFELDHKRHYADDIFEWCKEGVASHTDAVRHLELDVLEGWLEIFKERDGFYTADIEAMKDIRPKSYRILKSQGIRSIMVAPIRAGENVIGFVGVDDPRMHTDTLDLVKSITSFIMNELDRTEYLEELRYVSFRDPMTGFKNRRAYFEDIKALEADPIRSEEPIGIVFADVNGLKSTNDREGHDAGDKLILDMAHNLGYAFREADIYRLGGDEFVVFSFHKEEKAFLEKVQTLVDSWNEDVSAAVGCIWLEKAQNIEHNIELADERMYRDKQKFYESKFHDRRRSIEEEKIKEVVQGISQMFSSIFLVDFDTRQIFPYALNTDTPTTTKEQLVSGREYTSILQEFALKYVLEEDRERFAACTGLARVREELGKNPTFSFVIHRKNAKGKVETVEILFLRLKDRNWNHRTVMAMRILNV